MEQEADYTEDKPDGFAPADALVKKVEELERQREMLVRPVSYTHLTLPTKRIV